jgi:hypothetical protein
MFHGNHPGQGGSLLRLPQSFVVNQPVSHLDDVHVTVLDPPKLAGLKLLAVVCHFGLHIIKTDTGREELLRENRLQICNAFIGVVS